ncbi:unnamed protein product [Durusdinium trenchii]|uniref:Uncharacterized protein n=2 Tax=Durusdinium trenchii TaxID=1381693 RepID=A0ABP0PBS1_9DINO
MGPPARLVAAFTWAQKSVEWVDEQGHVEWLKKWHRVPWSSWFSGFGCAEMALSMIASALAKQTGKTVVPFSQSYQFEIANKARLASRECLEDHVCQHQDILRLLDDANRKKLKILEDSCEKPSEDLWTFLLDKKYDIFILEKYLEVVNDPAAIYASLVEHVQSLIEPVSVYDAAWMTYEENERDFRGEMIANRNANSTVAAHEVHSVNLSDWTPLLSDIEQKNYQQYLQSLGQDSLPRHEREIRGVCVGQDPVFMNMSGSPSKLPAFTTDSTKRIMLTDRDRWLTAAEKVAVTGFPVHKDYQGFVL